MEKILLSAYYVLDTVLHPRDLSSTGRQKSQFLSRYILLSRDRQYKKWATEELKGAEKQSRRGWGFSSVGRALA